VEKGQRTGGGDIKRKKKYRFRTRYRDGVRHSIGIYRYTEPREATLQTRRGIDEKRDIEKKGKLPVTSSA